VKREASVESERLRVKYTILGLFASLAVIFCTGCPEVLSPPETPAAAGPNVLVVRISGEAAARTALPSGIPSIDYYNIHVTRPGSPEPALGGGDGFRGPGPFAILLDRAPEPLDEVKVEGFDVNDAKIAEATYILPSPYHGEPIPIILRLPQTGNGALNLAISFPSGAAASDEITAVEVSLYRNFADYQAGNLYSFNRYQKTDYGVGENVSIALAGTYPSGDYVAQIDFFRFDSVRVSRLVQTIIVRDAYTTGKWDTTNTSALHWGKDKFASSRADLTGIKIDDASVPDFAATKYAYAISKPVTKAPEPKLLTMTGTPGQAIAVSLNGDDVGSGRSVYLPMKAANSIVIAVTAPDGVTKQTYTVSYTYYNQTEWYIRADGDDDNNAGEKADKPMKTMAKVMEKISDSYGLVSPVWPGKDADPSQHNPVAARINIMGTISGTDGMAVISGGNLPPILLGGLDSGKIDIGGLTDTRPLTIENGATVILEDGLILAGGNHINGGGGVHLSGGSRFIMNGGAITGNTSTATGSSNTGGGGVYAGSGSAFTMNGGTIGGSGSDKNTSYNDGGGVFVTGGSTFTMNGGIITGNTTAYGGGGMAAVSGGTFIMKGGNLDGNSANHGGGVILFNGGNTFRMEGGNITGNKAIDDLGHYGGGGVLLVKDSFTMTGGTISGNTVTGISTTLIGGGGVTNRGGTFTMEGGSISENTLSGKNGGGVYLGNIDGSPGTFTMTGGTIRGNNADSGGGVYFYEGDFNMGGNAFINQDNEAWLADGKKINIISALTFPSPSVARITPEIYTTGTQVLDGIYVLSNYGKFTVTPETGTNWTINSLGRLRQP
jgi:hypothetical protein